MDDQQSGPTASTTSAANADETKPVSFGKYETFAEYQSVLLRAIVDVTAAAGKLPSPGQEYDYYSSFPLLKRVMRAEGQTVLNLMSSVTGIHIGKQNMFQMEGTDTEEKVDVLTEVNDILLERAGISLDIAKGVKRNQTNDIQLATVSKQIDTIWNRRNEKLKRDAATASVTLLTAKNVARPQLSFPDKIDNSNNPFVPIIKEKPNALKPLAILVERQDDGREVFSHPYETEIEACKPTEEQLASHVRDPLPLSETPLEMVDTPESLERMMVDLRNQKYIAMDLEHHSFRSFQGFTCLIQISTWEKDYIVDPLILRGHLSVLNEVTTNPRIVKVLHGAISDVQWLQRDFGVYLVNLFDTGVAAKLLNFERLSLSFLLKHYMAVDADKRFQLVDWRVRPLPDDMLAYARGDTHYLLAIFERMKNDLVNASNIQGNLLHAAWERSTQICLRRYNKPLLEEDSHLQLVKSSHKNWNEKQLYALKHIYAWRDRLAREHDESIGYVLPNHMLLQIAELLPREIQGIIACCNPCPPLVKQQLNELHQIILRAREVHLSNRLLEAPKLKIPMAVTTSTVDMDNILHALHDIPALHAHDDTNIRLPTLLDDNGDKTVEADRPMKSSAEKTSSNEAPRLAQSTLFPRQKSELESGPLRGYSCLPGRYCVQLGPDCKTQLLRMITPYERYLKEVKRSEHERESLNQMLEAAKASATLQSPQQEAVAFSGNKLARPSGAPDVSGNRDDTNEPKSAIKVKGSNGQPINDKVGADHEDEMDAANEDDETDDQPTVIRGAKSRKRKRTEPSIPLTGGEETSYQNTQSSKLEKRKRKKMRQKLQRQQLQQQKQQAEQQQQQQQQQQPEQQQQQQQQPEQQQQQQQPEQEQRTVQPFDYAGAIKAQESSNEHPERQQQPEGQQQRLQQKQGTQGRGGYSGESSRQLRGRGRGRGAPQKQQQQQNKPRKQFDAMEGLREAESGASSRGGTHFRARGGRGRSAPAGRGRETSGPQLKGVQKRKFRGGNRSLIVARGGHQNQGRGRGQAGGSQNMHWPSR